MIFEKSLHQGRVGESLIASWMRQRGWSVLPVYDVEADYGKGPRLFLPYNLVVAPDMLVFKDSAVFWIEAKHKAAFAWNRMRGIWTTGIDRHHYHEYCRVDDETPWPVWLLFLHRGGQAKDSPSVSPAGLFGNTLSELRRKVNHESDKGGGPSGMVYWSKEALLEIAPLEEVMECNGTVVARVISSGYQTSGIVFE